MYETLLVWGCIYLYALASFILLTGFVFNKERLLRISDYLILPAFAGQTVLFVGRWIRTGYFPANGDLENAITGGWFAMAFTVYLFMKTKRQPVKGRTHNALALFVVLQQVHQPVARGNRV